MELGTSAAALGLYKYDCSEAKSDLFRRFYSAVLSQLEGYGVTPTYIGAEGIGYSGKFSKAGGRIHDTLLKSGFADVSVLSLSANPPNSDEPAYDSFAGASLSYVQVNQELLLCFVINEAFIGLRTAKYEGLLRSLIDLCRWDFGYGFSANADKQPDFHILGLDNGGLSAEEQEALNTWYAAPAEVRTAFLRDVYPYNILNEKQLNAEVENGVALRHFAEQQAGCSVTRLTDYGLHLWQVADDANVADLRKKLAGSPVLVS